MIKQLAGILLFCALTLCVVTLSATPSVSAQDNDCVIPQSGPWPPCATGDAAPASSSDCLIPPVGPWPPCATGGSTPPTSADANDCVIPQSGPWPPCATGGTTPATNGDCVIPQSGPWPPCATDNTPNPPASDAVALMLLARGFVQPVYITHANTSTLYVVERAGRIIALNPDGSRQTFLDIRGRVLSDESERGLLSIAFHPQYQNNGRLFVYYTNAAGDVVISEFDTTATPDIGRSERVVLTIGQPAQNHNGGQLQFGPDGMLYIGLGDGGGGGDPLGHGQNRATLLGAILRINIDGGVPYTVPTSNPFYAESLNSTIRGEIWSYGLRNPWRFSFDNASGDLYIADVGQDKWEEINFQPAGQGGHNYGWNAWEANDCFTSECSAQPQTPPALAYDHSQGCSVTGGYVYRGSAIANLGGQYIFADFCNGNIWRAGRTLSGDWQKQLLLTSGLPIASFGEGADQELYVLDFLDGAVYQLVTQVTRTE